MPVWATLDELAQAQGRGQRLSLRRRRPCQGVAYWPRGLASLEQMDYPVKSAGCHVGARPELQLEKCELSVLPWDKDAMSGT